MRSPAAIPVTYVPARNLIFLAVAAGWAETLGAADIFLGVNAVDYSGYPDCRPEFIESFEETSNLATQMGTEAGKALTIHTPLIDLTKADIVRLGQKARRRLLDHALVLRPLARWPRLRAVRLVRAPPAWIP